MKTTTALIAAIFLASAAQIPDNPFSDGTRTVDVFPGCSPYVVRLSIPFFQAIS